jgi:hypothetical protein
MYSALRNEEAMTIKSVIVCFLSLEFLSFVLFNASQ